MAVKKTASKFAELEEDFDTDEVVVADEQVVTSELKSARVKGTWTMYWGLEVFNFEDGKRYRIPTDLFAYLKDHGNIYDTL